MIQLNMCKKSVSFWASRIKDCGIKEIPQSKTAAELIGGY